MAGSVSRWVALFSFLKSRTDNIWTVVVIKYPVLSACHSTDYISDML